MLHYWLILFLIFCASSLTCRAHDRHHHHIVGGNRGQGLTLSTYLDNEIFTTLQPREASTRRKRRAKRRTSSSAIRQLKIKIFYDSSLQDLPQKKRSILKDIVFPISVNHWQTSLRVKRSNRRIRLNRKCKDNQYFINQNSDSSNIFCKERCVLTKCGEFIVPESHLNPCQTCDSRGFNCLQSNQSSSKGVQNADFILYVSSIETQQCRQAIIRGGSAQTVAYAAHCQQESTYDRPIAGHTNICPSSLRYIGQSGERGEKEKKALINTIKHELLHALGFSSSLYAFWRDAKGLPRTPRDSTDGKPPIDYARSIRQWSNNTILRVYRSKWQVAGGYVKRGFDLMVTPGVVREARAHFGCGGMLGVELEDQGGDGTALTHWEKRLFHNEAMTGTVHTEEPIYSRVTFALMEDTGWYLPNYQMADDLPWGKNLGCDFVHKSCMEIMEMKTLISTDGTLHPSPFCTTLPSKTSKTECNFDLSAIGNCNLIQYTEPLPKIYRNFKSLSGVSYKDIHKVGSSVALADYCPYIQEFNWSYGPNNNKSRATICKDPMNQPENSLNFGLESYQKESVCLKQPDAWIQESAFQSRHLKRYGSGCYPVFCDQTDGHLYVHVNGIPFKCNKDGDIQNISIEKSATKSGFKHSGSLICPSCSRICGKGFCTIKN